MDMEEVTCPHSQVLSDVYGASCTSSPQPTDARMKRSLTKPKNIVMVGTTRLNSWSMNYPFSWTPTVLLAEDKWQTLQNLPVPYHRQFEQMLFLRSSKKKERKELDRDESFRITHTKPLTSDTDGLPLTTFESKRISDGPFRRERRDLGSNFARNHAVKGTPAPKLSKVFFADPNATRRSVSAVPADQPEENGGQYKEKPRASSVQGIHPIEGIAQPQQSAAPIRFGIWELQVSKGLGNSINSVTSGNLPHPPYGEVTAFTSTTYGLKVPERTPTKPRTAATRTRSLDSQDLRFSQKSTISKSRSSEPSSSVADNGKKTGNSRTVRRNSRNEGLDPWQPMVPKRRGSWRPWLSTEDDISFFMTKQVFPSRPSSSNRSRPSSSLSRESSRSNSKSRPSSPLLSPESTVEFYNHQRGTIRMRGISKERKVSENGAEDGHEEDRAVLPFAFDRR